MPEQLYYTWSTIGYGDIPGFRLRAASPGLADSNGERYNALRSFFNYYLPPGTDPYQAAIELSPRCLLYTSNGKEWLVAHKTYGDKDAYGRPGNFFTHLVAGLPESFVARDAIALWGATAFWQSSDKTIPSATTLPGLSTDLLTKYQGTLSERNLLLARERNLPPLSEYLPLLIQAYLSLGEQQTIYIAAPPEQVAALIWGLAQCLPRSMQRELTFSTYESDVLKASMRIIGTCEPQTPMLNGYNKAPKLLPAVCYNGTNWVIDCYQRSQVFKASVSSDIIEFSNYVSSLLLQGQRAILQQRDGVLAVAERNQVTTSKELLFVYTIASGKPLYRTHIEGLFSNRALVIKFLREEKCQDPIIRLALQDPQWWKTKAQPSLLKLREQPRGTLKNEQANEVADALAAFGGRVANQLCAAMLKSDLTIDILLDILSDITPPDREFRPWLELLLAFDEQARQKKEALQINKEFDWKTRRWLLQQWTHEAAKIQDEFIRPWLMMNWTEFMEFRTEDAAPEKWYRIALSELIEHSRERMPKQGVKLLKNPRDYDLFKEVLLRLMRSTQTQPAALRCFETIVESGYKDKELVMLLASLLDAGTVAPANIDSFIRAAQLRREEKIALLEQYPDVVPHLLASQKQATPAVVDLISTYLNTLTFKKLVGESSAINKLLGKAALRTVPHLLQSLYTHKSKLSAEVAATLLDWLLIDDSLLLPDNPTPSLRLDEKYQSRLGTAIARLKLHDHKVYREDHLYLVLFANIRTADDVQHVLDGLSPALGTRLALFSDFATFIGDRYTAKVSHAKLLPYIEEVLDHTAHLDSASGKHKYMNATLQPLLRHVNRKSRAFQLLENEVNEWPRDLRKEWALFMKQPVPPPPPVPMPDVKDIGGNIIGKGGQLLGNAMVIGGNLLNQGRNAIQDAQQRAEEQERQRQADLKRLQDAQANTEVTPTFHSDQTVQEDVRNRAGNEIQVVDNSAKNQVDALLSQNNSGASTGAVQANPEAREAEQQKNRDNNHADKSADPHPSSHAPEPLADNNTRVITVTIHGEPLRDDGQAASISAAQIEKTFQFKELYVPLRMKELEKETLSDWREDEISELLTQYSRQDTERVLIHDLFIANALAHYSSNSHQDQKIQRVQTDLRKSITKQVQNAAKATTPAIPIKDDVLEVLEVFVRYRTLAVYFKENRQPIRMSEWLSRQFSMAEIKDTTDGDNDEST